MKTDCDTPEAAAGQGAGQARGGRRRFLTIAAAAAGSALALGAGAAAGSAGTDAWRGQAMGALATIRLGGIGRARAAETFAAVRAEVARLEDIFSLHRDGSALARLNREGRLARPPADLLAVLDLSAALHRATGGAFDPSIQPLWLARAAGADRAALDRAAAAVGWAGLEHDAERVAFRRPGMALTLNGIAQGHVADRIAALLRARGFADVLVDMGEIVALGRNHGTPWQAGIAAPDAAAPLDRVALEGRALAVSAPLGTRLGAGGGHILDPRGRAAPVAWRLAAVTAESAALADGLSTGCCLLDRPAAEAAVARFAGARLERLV